MGVIPMGFAKYNKASSAAGFFDFSSYMGAGIAGFVTGSISEHWGWNGALVMWIIIAFGGSMPAGEKAALTCMHQYCRY